MTTPMTGAIPLTREEAKFALKATAAAKKKPLRPSDFKQVNSKVPDGFIDARKHILVCILDEDDPNEPSYLLIPVARLGLKTIQWLATVSKDDQEWDAIADDEAYENDYGRKTRFFKPYAVITRFHKSD